MIVKLKDREINTEKPKYGGYNKLTCEQYCKFRKNCEELGLDKDELDKAHIALFYDITFQELYSLPINVYNDMVANTSSYINLAVESKYTYYQHKGVFYHLYLDIDNMKVGHFADIEHIEAQFPNIWDRLPNIVSILLYTEDQLDSNDTLNYNGSIAMSRVEQVKEFPFSVILSFHNLYIQKKKTLQIITQKYMETVKQLEMLKGMLINKQLELKLT